MGWLGMGSYVQKFEERLVDYLELDGKHLACVNTGHSALHLALVLAGVGLLLPIKGSDTINCMARLTGIRRINCIRPLYLSKDQPSSFLSFFLSLPRIMSNRLSITASFV